MRFFHVVCLLVGFLWMSHDAIAQKEQDFGLWSGVDVRVPLTKKLDAGLEVQMRFKNNVTAIDNSFFSPYIKYDLHKHFGLGIDYRWSNEPKGGGMFGPDNFHRVTLDLEAKKLVELFAENTRLDASFRLRGTHETTNGDRNNDYLRMQLEFKYNIPGIKLEPELSGELFYHFNDQLSYSFSEVQSRGRMNKFRVKLGLNYQLNKRQQLKLFYMIQSFTESPKTDFVLGVGYSYRFKRLGKD